MTVCRIDFLPRIDGQNRPDLRSLGKVGVEIGMRKGLRPVRNGKRLQVSAKHRPGPF